MNCRLCGGAHRGWERCKKNVTPQTGVTHGVTEHEPQTQTTEESSGRVPDVQAAQGEWLQGAKAAIPGAARKGDRHKLGQAAYMRQWRAKRKANAAAG